MGLDLRKLRALAAEKAEDMKGKGGGDYPPWMDLDEDEEFVGTITEIRENTFDDSGKTHMYEVASLAAPDEKFTLRAHKSLVSKLEKQDPEIGSIVYIKNIGKVKSQKSKFKYNDYEVLVLSKEEYEETQEPAKKAATKKPAKPAPEDDEDDDPKPTKTEKKGGLIKMDGDELKKLKSYVGKALEFNDNSVDLTELIRLVKAKGVKFSDEDDAKKKLLYAGFDVSEDDIVSKP
jgi:hypothetical protein